MNKSILSIGISILLIAFISCKKDKTAPEITLNGSQEVEVVFKSTYADAGATAIDDEDGNITSKITIDNPVNTSQLGTYTVNYTVSDERGNTASATRTVKVVMKASNYSGDYDVTDDCGLTAPVNASQTITVLGTNRIQFEGFFTLLGGNIPATVNGTNITLDETTVSGYLVNGSGTMSADGNTITLNLSIDPPFLSLTTCLATYSRK